MHRRALVIMSSIASAALIVGVAPAAFSGEVEDAPLPRCQRSPGTVDQGDDVEITGDGWEAESTVTVAFDGDDDLVDDDLTDDTTPDTTDDTTDDTTHDTLDESSEDEGSPDDGVAVSADVDEDGEFEVDLTIPELATRGTHSLNVTGTDEDGLAASCARTIRLLEHPEDTTDDTTATTSDDDGDGETPGSSGSTPSTAPTTTSSSP